MASTGPERMAAHRRRRAVHRGALLALASSVVVLGVLGAATTDDRSESAPAAPTQTPTPDSATGSPPTLLKPSPRSAGRSERVHDERRLPPSSRHPAAGVPTRVAVQRLAIDVPVLPIAPEGGVLVPPADPRVLGWYRYGARPGAVHGSAVITGHTVHTGGGALDELDDLRAGDTIRVSTAKGTIGYRVSSVAIVSKPQLARRAQKVFSSTVAGRLVLITCTDWNGQEYLSNTLVYAAPAPTT